jgi:hypothetical protein
MKKMSENMENVFKIENSGLPVRETKWRPELWGENGLEGVTP